MLQKEIELSPQFKKQTNKAITSILVFSIVYFLIFTSALALTVLCAYSAFAIISAMPGFITIALGIGLVSLGFFIILFLLKFIFKSNKTDRSHLTEITEQNEPALFRLIKDIVEEVGTDFPKKVYLSSEVNASVFYDSNFWSMFLPIRKNLHIGMGLVNSISKNEFKAILSHEFGHFSQKSMKVGSFVYNVNQIIFNMLYDNDSYNKMIEGWANSSGYFGFFIVFAVKIIEGIQWILKYMYEIINKNYLGLSREMEFHADEIAANITGYEPLKTALLRMNLADYTFNSVLAIYESKISENIKSENIFKEQSYIMQFIAKDDNIPTVNSLPQVTIELLNKFNKSKLIIKDQWASHPSTEERIKKLEEKNLQFDNEDTKLANELFQHITELQKQLTQKLFETVQYEKSPTIYPLVDFKSEYEEKYLKNIFPKFFNAYYDDKNPNLFDISKIAPIDNSIPINTLFSNQNVNLNYEAVALKNDMELIKQILEKTIDIKSFDYDGKKFKRKESSSLLLQLEERFHMLNNQISENDILIFQSFLNLESSKNDTSKLTLLYDSFFQFDKEYDSKTKEIAELSKKLEFVNFTTPYKEIESNFKIIENLETSIKMNINNLKNETKIISEITPEIKKNFDTYLSKNWSYFTNEAYNNDNLEMLFLALDNYAYLLSRIYFFHKKELLDYQVSLIETQNVELSQKKIKSVSQL